MFVSARAAFEYDRMFDLESVPLDASILDCGSGASSFVAKSRTQGRIVYGLDPVYNMPLAAITEQVEHGVEITIKNIRSEPDRYVWGPVFKDPAQHARARRAAAAEFLESYGSYPGRGGAYVAGSVADIPFSNDSVDIVVCSHLLFTHSATLTPDDHVTAIAEMVRVARREVRIFPTFSFYGDSDRAIRAVLQFLEKKEIRAIIEPVSYVFQKGGGSGKMLRVITN